MQVYRGIGFYKRVNRQEVLSMPWLQKNEPPKRNEDEPAIRLELRLKEETLMTILKMILPIIAAGLGLGLGVGPTLIKEDIPRREQLPSHETQLESETTTSTNSK